MNTVVTLTDGRKIDVLDLQGYSYDCWFGHPGNGQLKMRDGTIHNNVCIRDIETIEVFRKELNEIKNED